MKVLELWTANTILSMWTVAGTDSKNVARSVCGLEVTNLDGRLDMVYTVGGRWFVGIRATGSGGISTTVGWVGGRDSKDGPSIISVSSASAEKSFWVFLVFGAIVQRKCESTKKGEKVETDFLAR